MDITRRDLFKMAGAAAIGAAVGQFNVAQAASKKNSQVQRGSGRRQ